MKPFICTLISSSIHYYTFFCRQHISFALMLHTNAQAWFVLFKEQWMLLSLYAHWCYVLCYSASSKETKMHRNHTWHTVLRQPLHFISNRQFSMFTSSLSAWETLMEKSQGGNGILSLRVTTAAWFNETVCQKAKQQPVNKQAEVTYARTHTRGMCAVEQHNSDGLSKTHRSLFFTRTNAKGKKATARMSKKLLARAKTGRDEDSSAQNPSREIGG